MYRFLWDEGFPVLDGLHWTLETPFIFLNPLIIRLESCNYGNDNTVRMYCVRLESYRE